MWKLLNDRHQVAEARRFSIQFQSLSNFIIFPSSAVVSEIPLILESSTSQSLFSFSAFFRFSCFFLSIKNKINETATSTIQCNSTISILFTHRRPHQTLKPVARISNGINKRVRKRILLIWAWFKLSCWDSGVFGRIDIKSSSSESQLIMLRNKSAFPLKLIMALMANREVPTTTKRPFSFFIKGELFSPAG